MKAKAVALISGGLDSMLAAKVILDQGIHVEGLNFFTGFCHSGHTSAIRSKSKVKRNDALWVAEQLGIKLHIIDVVEEYKKVLFEPKYGYGKHFNPCLDCKMFMVNKAYAWMKEHSYDFIITGEVIGQRPNSQLKSKMQIVNNSLAEDGYLLRPLSAKNLPPTLIEKNGIVDREKLFAFSGRGRKPQLELAKQQKITEFAQPAGGCCVLTDASYSKKLQDLLQFKQDADYSLDDIILLKIGRHFRLSDTAKLIVSRDEAEGKFLSGYRYKYTSLEALEHAGAFGLLYGNASEDDLQLAAKIVARYSKTEDQAKVDVTFQTPKGESFVKTILPFTPEDIKQDWYI